MHREYSSGAGSIIAFDTARLMHVLTIFGVVYALLCRFWLFPLEAYWCLILRILSRTRSTWGFCFGDSAIQNVPAIFQHFRPFCSGLGLDYVVSVRFNKKRGLSMARNSKPKPDRRINRWERWERKLRGRFVPPPLPLWKTLGSSSNISIAVLKHEDVNHPRM